MHGPNEDIDYLAEPGDLLVAIVLGATISSGTSARHMLAAK